jgi:hypothetical protein
LARERAGEVSDVDAEQWRVGVRAGQRHQGVECAGGEVGEERAVALGGYRLLRVHVESLEPGGGDRREGVELGTECAKWADQLGADDGAAEAGGFHHRPGPAAQELGDLGEGRQPQDPADGGDRVRHRVGPLAPGVEDLCGALDREEQRSRIQLGHRIQHSSRSRSRRGRCRPRL